MAEGKSLTGVRKRQQIASASKQMMIWVACAAAILTICAMVSINLVQHIIYQAKVIDEKSQTDETLKNSIAEFPKLKENINALQTNSGLLALRADMDDTAFNVVIDALPTEDDSTALGSSLQDKILVNSGVVWNDFSPSYGTSASTSTDDTGEESTTLLSKPAAQQLTFSFSINGNYASIKQALIDIERTIRPINITSLSIQGSDSNLSASITATTYYAPKATYAIGSKQVLPDGYDESSATAEATEEE
mgnify:CR=1 FL=1